MASCIVGEGMTINEFGALYGGGKFKRKEFELDNIIKRFKTICPDYNDDFISAETKSVAATFCGKVIFKIGPESRRANMNNLGKKRWIFNFSPQKVENSVKSPKVEIYSHEDSIPKYQTTDENLLMTVKQAELLALTFWNKITDFHASQPQPAILLTPTALAIFTVDSVNKIADMTGQTKATVVKVINTSTKADGQYLPESHISVAAVLLLSALKVTGVRQSENDKNMRIIAERLRLYTEKDKKHDPNIFRAYALHATENLPLELYPNLLRVVQVVGEHE